MGFSVGGGAQKFPSWTAPLTRFLFEGSTPGTEGDQGPPAQGLIGDAWAGQQAFPSGSLFQGLSDMIANAQRGGAGTQQLAVQGTQRGYGNASGLADQAAQTAGQAGGIAGLIPGALSAANAYAGGINHAQSQFQPAYGAAQSALQDVMNPTQQNSLYNNAANLLTPRVRSAFSARGLGTSGQAVQEEGNQLQQLADSFALRQAQERQSAISGVGNLASQGGNLGVAASQVPGAILNGMQGVANGAIQAQQGAGALQQLPLAIGQQGQQLYQAGMNMPLDYQQALYNFTRQPGLQLLSALAGTLQSSNNRWGLGKGSAG